MNTPWNVIVDHCLESMPSDLPARRRLLSALVSVIPTQLHRHRELAVSLGHLDSHLLAQRELCLGLGVAVVEAAARGSGRLGDTPMERTAPSARPVKGGRR